VSGEEKNILYWPTREAKADQNLLYRHDKPNDPTKKEPISFVHFETPFTSVSTFSRGHPSLFSLVAAMHRFAIETQEDKALLEV
jgi:hypothetical protein